MERYRQILLTLTAVTLVGALGACDSDSGAEDDGLPAETNLVEDLPADPPTGRDEFGQPTGTTGKYTLYSIMENKVVANADSATTQWDLGFRSTSIIVNGGTSGPGQAGVILFGPEPDTPGIPFQNGVFEDLVEAPTTGYRSDSDPDFAVPAKSGDGWYNYNPQQFLVTPIPGRFFVVRTADGKYAKLRILSYYKKAPPSPDAFFDLDRYYTFEYVFQPDGSTDLAE